MFPVSVWHAWTTSRTSSSSANTKGNQAFSSFICIKWWGWACHVRNVASASRFVARSSRWFSSRISLRRGPMAPTTPREQLASPIIKSPSRCKLKNRRIFPRNFPAASRFSNQRCLIRFSVHFQHPCVTDVCFPRKGGAPLFFYVRFFLAARDWFREVDCTAICFPACYSDFV